MSIHTDMTMMVVYPTNIMNSTGDFMSFECMKDCITDLYKGGYMTHDDYLKYKGFLNMLRRDGIMPSSENFWCASEQKHMKWVVAINNIFKMYFKFVDNYVTKQFKTYTPTADYIIPEDIGKYRKRFVLNVDKKKCYEEVESMDHFCTDCCKEMNLPMMMDKNHINKMVWQDDADYSHYPFVNYETVMGMGEKPGCFVCMK